MAERIMKKAFRIRQEKFATEPEKPKFYNLPNTKPPYIPEYLDSGIEVGDLVKILAG